MAQKIKVAVVQIAPHPNNALRMAQSVADQVYEVAKQGARLIVFPEALIGEDQKGDPFDCQITQRNIEVRETYAKYYVSAIYLDGPEIACISKAAANTGAFVVIGIIERYLGRVYCTALYFDGEKGLIGQHRKPMPMAGEACKRDAGDGSAEEVVTTEFGTLSALISWVNDMPELRVNMHSQGVTFRCVPTEGDNGTWLPTMQYIDKEKRRFDVRECQLITRAVDGELGESRPVDCTSASQIYGDGAIIDPFENVPACASFSGKAIFVAELEAMNRDRKDFDFVVPQNCARPDGLSLTLDTKTRGHSR